MKRFSNKTKKLLKWVLVFLFSTLALSALERIPSGEHTLIVLGKVLLFILQVFSGLVCLGVFGSSREMPTAEDQDIDDK